jgi:CDP-2,3-bis-(O-geranylgeranyl)-sn-glycerol synthase
MDALQVVIEAIKFIFPAYCANAVPVIVGGGLPLDLNRNFVDGKPIFGKNKTFRGFLLGLAVGTGVGYLETVIFRYPIFLGFLLSLGALLGDLVEAFFKRRLSLAPGAPLPVADQVDFVLGAVLFSLPISIQFLSWEIVLSVLLISPPIHVLTNYGAFKLGLKKNPW